MFDNWNSVVGGLLWIFGGIVFVLALAALLALAAVIFRSKRQGKEKAD